MPLRNTGDRSEIDKIFGQCSGIVHVDLEHVDVIGLSREKVTEMASRGAVRSARTNDADIVPPRLRPGLGALATWLEAAHSPPQTIVTEAPEAMVGSITDAKPISSCRSFMSRSLAIDLSRRPCRNFWLSI